MSLMLILSFTACKKKSVKKDNVKADSSAFTDSSDVIDGQDSESETEKNDESALKEGIEALESAEITIEKSSDTSESEDYADSSLASEVSDTKESESSSEDEYYHGYY